MGGFKPDNWGLETNWQLSVVALTLQAFAEVFYNIKQQMRTKAIREYRQKDIFVKNEKQADYPFVHPLHHELC